MAQLPAKKRRKLSPSEYSSSETLLGSPVNKPKPFSTQEYVANAAEWSLEQDYEVRPRTLEKNNKQSTKLPIKTETGRIQQVHNLEHQENSDDTGSEDEIVPEPEVESANEQEAVIPPEQLIAQAKEQLARIAMSINRDPEEHVSSLKTLAEISNSSNDFVKSLAIATQMAVFKDIIPGYSIRPLGDIELAEKVSKDVRKLRNFEQALVRSYRIYVDELVKYAKGSGEDAHRGAAKIGSVAISCACQLVLSASHFNFSGDLIAILVRKLSSKVTDQDFIQCRTALETLFRDDQDGNPSLVAVAGIARMIKARDYHVDESVVNSFLHLRLLSDLSIRASHSKIDKPEPAAEMMSKRRKKDRQFRTKKERKAVKEFKAVEKEFRETNAIVEHEKRDKLQAEALKLVFGTYFRILKAQVSSLTGAVLEGLTKFARLVNRDFFGDLLEVLREIGSSAAAEIDPSFKPFLETPKGEDETSLSHDWSTTNSDPTRTALLAITTAFSLLSAQDAAFLSLDLSSFASLLHTLLMSLPLYPSLEHSRQTSSSPSAEEFEQAPKINVATGSVLLLRALRAALGPRATPRMRLGAFTHRLLTLALLSPERTSAAVLALVKDLSRFHGSKIAPLWSTETRREDGTFDPIAGIETCRPFCGTVWQGELLRLHYADGVRETSTEVNRTFGKILGSQR